MTALPGFRISALLCIAYDWQRAGAAIASVWDIADEIIVSYDRQGITWSGHPFEPPTEWRLFDLIRGHLGGRFSRERLRFLTGDFYLDGRDRQGLQIQQRLALAQLAKLGNWQLTLDADEEVIEPGRFVSDIPPPQPGLGLTCEFRSVYKVLGETALVFDSRRHFPIAQADPGVFIDGRSRAQHWLPVAGTVLHHHMDRSEDELRLKLAALTPTTYSIEDVVQAWRRTNLGNFRDTALRPGTCYAPDTPLRAIPTQMLRAPSGAELGGGRVL